MIINNEYDVFIAYHGSNGKDSSLGRAESIRDELNSRGIKCFLFSKDSGSSSYKANFIEIMKSRLLLLVCNEKLARKNSGEIDFEKNYHLYVELDTFYALAQARLRSREDAAILYSDMGGNFRTDLSPATLHPLFDNRASYCIEKLPVKEKIPEKILEWLNRRLENYKNNDTANEVVSILAERGSDILSRSVDGIKFKDILQKATRVRCIGISNWMVAKNRCDIITNGLDGDTKFELLFLNPRGKCVKLRAEEENKNIRNQINDSYDTLISELKRYIKNNPDNKRKLKERLSTYEYDMIPRENLIFIDFIYKIINEGKEDNKEATLLIVQNYSHAEPGKSSPTFILRREKDQESTMFDYYERIYNNIKKDKKTKRTNLFRHPFIF